jgi:hypothetical protein
MQKLDKDQMLFIWNEYKDNLDWMRHNESQRAMITQILLGIAAALVALFPEEPAAGDWRIPAFLIGVGVFGILVVLKYWERFSFHNAQAHHFRRLLDAFFPPVDGEPEGSEHLFIHTREQGRKDHNKKLFPVLKDPYFMQHGLWVGLFFAIIFFGIELLRRVP